MNPKPTSSWELVLRFAMSRRSRLLGISDMGYDFHFTKRWFISCGNKNVFSKRVLPMWKDRPLVYLELGVFEGMSFVWMLKHVLVHPQSRAVGIDPWLMTTKLLPEAMSDVRKCAFHNIKPFVSQCELIQANSGEVLRWMVRGRGFKGISRCSVDLCFIDGNHYSLAVLDDARLCLQLLKVGGWLLFDDVVTKNDKEDFVKCGLRLFLEEARDEVELVWKEGRMEAYRKVRIKYES